MAGRYCLLVWGDAEETKGNGRRRWRGVGPAGRPFLFPFGVSVILKVRVYDFGDEVADRYTIVYVNKNIKDGYGVVYYPVFSCSEDPFHPLGVGMYAGDYYPHRSHMYNFGKRVKDIDSLPKKVIEFIKYITR